MRKILSDKAVGCKGVQGNGRTREQEAWSLAFGEYCKHFWAAHARGFVAASPLVMNACAAIPSEFNRLATGLAQQVNQAPSGVPGRRHPAEFSPVCKAFRRLSEQGSEAVAVAVMREYARNPAPFVELAIHYSENVGFYVKQPMVAEAQHVARKPRYTASCVLPPGLAREVREAAAAEGVSVSEWVRRSLKVASVVKRVRQTAEAGRVDEREGVPTADLAEIFNYEGGEIVTEPAPIRAGMAVAP